MPKVRRSKDEFTPRHADVGDAPREEPEFPALTKIRAYDRMQHVQAAQDVTDREAAERHADEHLAERDDAETE